MFDYNRYDALLWTWLAVYPMAAERYDYPNCDIRSLDFVEQKSIFAPLESTDTSSRLQSMSDYLDRVVAPLREIGYTKIAPYLHKGVFRTEDIVSAVEHTIDPDFVGAL